MSSLDGGGRGPGGPRISSPAMERDRLRVRVNDMRVRGYVVLKVLPLVKCPGQSAGSGWCQPIHPVRLCSGP
jgi:hypothetical protein